MRIAVAVVSTLAASGALAAILHSPAPAARTTPTRSTRARPDLSFLLVALVAPAQADADGPGTPRVAPPPLDPRAVDLLFVVDDSGSAAGDGLARKIGAPMDAFLTRLDGAGVDYRIAITTTDMDSSERSGRFVGNPRSRVLTPETRDGVGNFRENLNEALSRTGSSSEQGLSAATAAIFSSLTDPDRAFVRPAATLHLVFVSDEQDASSVSLEEVRGAFLVAKDADPSRVVVTAIVGPASCKAPADPEQARRWQAFLDAMPSDENRYETLARESNGIVGDLCAEDYSAPLGELAERISAAAGGRELSRR